VSQLSNRDEMTVSIILEGDDAGLEQLAINLRRELLLLDEVSVKPAHSGDVPERARALEALALGKLIVKFGPSALKLLSTTIRAWMERSRARSVELTIDGDTIKLNKASMKEQDQLLSLFVARHSSAADSSN
jgi:hypothetical protein